MFRAIIRTWMCLFFLGFGIAAIAQTAQNEPAVKNESGNTGQVAQKPDALVANSRYVIRGDTVFDKKTNLTWQRCSVGQEWTEGKGCLGLRTLFNFNAAQGLKNKVWRVPTKEELETLIDLDRKSKGLCPMIDVIAFPNVESQSFWTSTSIDDSLALFVDFSCFALGNGSAYRSVMFPVRLVRTGQ